MRRNIVSGLIGGAALLVAGWLLGRLGVETPPLPADGVKVVAAPTGVTPAPPAGARATTAPALPTPAATPDSAPAHVPEDDAVRGAFLDPAFEPKALYRRLRAEPVDPAAAARMQRAIDGGLGKIPYLDREQLRVRCATTLCEIHGPFAHGATSDNVNVAMQQLQGDQLRTPLAAAGLEIITAAFGPDGFTLYTRRN
ncbi:hypothetical protein [Sphingomonas sp. 8AM]|uniref:hypothetical protein n=1 Tax=Sphingomonas sp. 8AM TaxID=2653170 RepID=UPI0012F40B55|nr:hypothetical protein [Sphingomonas sp. 8AM]VXC36430.1 conserved hypothetical protein [Sphingomonas sp. 8AM]